MFRALRTSPNVCVGFVRRVSHKKTKKQKRRLIFAPTHARGMPRLAEPRFCVWPAVLKNSLLSRIGQGENLTRLCVCGCGDRALEGWAGKGGKIKNLLHTPPDQTVAMCVLTYNNFPFPALLPQPTESSAPVGQRAHRCVRAEKGRARVFVRNVCVYVWVCLRKCTFISAVPRTRRFAIAIWSLIEEATFDHRSLAVAVYYWGGCNEAHNSSTDLVL